MQINLVNPTNYDNNWPLSYSEPFLKNISSYTGQLASHVQKGFKNRYIHFFLLALCFVNRANYTAEMHTVGYFSWQHHRHL